MKTALFATSLLAAVAAVADIAVPEVSNVTIGQSSDTRRVTVHYSLANAPAIVIVDICTNGVSIGDENLHYFTGDCNKVVQPGANKTVRWQADKSWPGHEIVGNNVTAKVYAWALDNPPDYMVVDLVAHNTVNYYTSTNALPDGGLTNDVYRTDRLVMRHIRAAGEMFTMGSSELRTADPQYPREVPHQAQLDHDYWMAVFELTKKQYKNIPGPERSSAFNVDGDVRPMINLNYNILRESSGDSANAAARYPNAPAAASVLGVLRAKTGLAFDLPGEAEWEYACRAGTGNGCWNDGSAETGAYKTWGTDTEGTRFSSDDNLSLLARYPRSGGLVFSNGASSASPTSLDWGVGLANATAKVGSYTPNAWGLYDMHGNAKEICLDYYKEDITGDNGAINTTANADETHVVRGGSFSWGPIYCRSAARDYKAANYTTPDLRNQDLGCRLVCPFGE